MTFAQFVTADLDAATRARLARGQLATEVLKQGQYQPLSLADEVTVLFAVDSGLMEDISLEQAGAFEEGLLRFVSSTHPDIGQAITESGDISSETEAKLTAAITAFKSTFTA